MCAPESTHIDAADVDVPPSEIGTYAIGRALGNDWLVGAPVVR